MTAGSDFHGTNKPTIRLGMSLEEEDTFIAPFLVGLSARNLRKNSLARVDEK